MSGSAIEPEIESRAVEPADRLSRVGPLAARVAAHAAAALGLAVTAVDPERPLTALGLDSLAAVEVEAGLAAELGASPPLSLLLGGGSCDDLARWLAAAQEAAQEAAAAEAAPEAAATGGAAAASPLSAAVSSVPAASSAAARVRAGVVVAAPLSPGQQALWFLERLAPTAGAYNVVAAAEARGLDPGALARALTALAARHAALRTRFPLQAEQPVQQVAAAPAIDFALVDAAAWRPARLRQELAAAAWQPFELERGPLLRVRVYAPPAAGPWSGALLLFAVHHLVADFGSLRILARELGELLDDAAAAGDRHPAPRAPVAPPLPTYLDCARAQAAGLAGPEGERGWAFWRDTLAGARGAVPDLALPTDRPRPAVQSWRGLARTAVMAAAPAAALRRMGAAEGATLFAALAAVWQLQLGRIAGQEDFALGTPTSGRRAAAAAGVVGYFVNAVALRADLRGTPAVGELVQRVRRSLVAALDHADYPFAWLAGRLRPARDAARPPLFQVMLALEPHRRGDPPGMAAFALGEDGARLSLGGGVELISVALDERRAQVELTLSVAELAGGGLALALEANADLFDAASVDRMLGHFLTLAAAAAAHPERVVWDLPLLTAAEQEQLRREWEWQGGPEAPAAGVSAPSRPVALALHELVAASARRTPAAVAVVIGDASWTYGQLLARAESLAGRLRRLPGVRPGSERPIALLVERSLDLVAGALAILAAGGTLLPLDPEHALPRLAWMLADAGAAAVLGERRLAARLPDLTVPWVLVDEAAADAEAEAAVDEPATSAAAAAATGRATAAAAAEPPAPAPSPMSWQGGELAYLIYTSGSTGAPKGVAVAHAAAAAELLSAARTLGLAAGDRVLQLPSAGFDAALEQIFATLLAGATLVLRGPEPWGPRELGAAVAAQQVTVADIPTSFLVRWVAAAPVPAAALPAALRLVMVSGEELRAETVRRYGASPLAAVALWNCYGPTEAVVSATLHAVQPGDGAAGPVPIGRALPLRVARVLDRHGQPQPLGVPGELCLGGLLARGYHARPAATAASFVPDPWGAAGERLYRTGDLVRRRAPDGVIEFLGRLDDQVKVRGFRVEPGEIAAALAEHPAIAEAAVLAWRPAVEEAGAGPAREAGEDERAVRLVAFVAPELPADLAAFAARRLPSYMIPAAWLGLPRLPATVAGKVDRAALAGRAAEARPLRVAAGGAGGGEAAPRHGSRAAVEELLAGAWAALLGREAVGRHDDFFALGGHSLLATRVVAQVSRWFGIDLPLSAVFATPTVAGLAERIAAATDADPAVRGAAAPPLVPGVHDPERLPLSFAQRRLWFLEQLAPGTALYNIPGAMQLSGPLDPAALAATLAEIARRHQVLRTAITAVAGEPAQRLLPNAGGLALVDLAALPPPALREETERLSDAEARQPFDLARGPLLRTTLLRLGARDHRLLATFHHIAADGWSLGLFLDELAALYPRLAAPHAVAAPGAPGEPPALPRLAVQYADFAAWQGAWLAGAAEERELAYWRSRLAGVAATELPTDRPRPPAQSVRGATRVAVLPAATAAAIVGLAGREGVTLFMALLGIFQALAGRLSGDERVAVGTPVANRRRVEVEPLIGLFVNTLVLDVELGDDPTLPTLLGRVRQACLGAYAHQDLPFERLVEELRPSRDLARQPFFQLMFVVEEPLPERHLAAPPAALEGAGAAGSAAAVESTASVVEGAAALGSAGAEESAGVFAGSGGSLRLAPLRRTTGTAKFDLLLAVTPDERGGWLAVAEYATALWEPASIDRLLGHFDVLLAAAAAAPRDARLSTLPMLSAAQRHQVVMEWNAPLAAPWSATAPPIPAGALLHQLVAAQAARTPDAVALVAGGERLSYAGLAAAALRLAVRLRRLGAGPEVCVGVCLGRTAGLLTAILGVLESGAAYVPLDPALPPRRLHAMLAASGAALLVTDRAEAARLAATGAFAGSVLLVAEPGDGESALAASPPVAPASPTALDSAVALEPQGSLGPLVTSGSPGSPAGLELPGSLGSSVASGLSGSPAALVSPGLSGSSVAPESLAAPASPGFAGGPAMVPLAAGDRGLAYVIFTSGSTGEPKAVGIEHAGAVALVRWALGAYSAGELAGVVAATSIGFDLSIFEMFVPLACGGRVILAPSIVELREVAASGEVTLLNTVPSPMAELAAGPLPPGLRTVNLAGEALPPPLVAQLAAHPQIERVVNLYGPSEATTYSTWAEVWSRRSALRGAGDPISVTIGRPIAGTYSRLLGRGGELLPIGAPGELALGGDGLARGYLGRPDLTAERFVPDPCGARGARLYRTGDRARLLPDGRLDYLGRLDHQLKIRGVRIEPGEIAALLARHPEVGQAVVVARTDGDSAAGPRLAAYVVPATAADAPRAAEDAELIARLDAWLRERLPAPMVPAGWAVLAALPLSPNGKVDRRALPAPATLAPAAAAADDEAAPRLGAEAVLSEIWCDILRIERIGRQDDFFALGGHSLLALRAAFRVGAAFGIDVPVAALFQAPTVAALAAWLAARGAGAGASSDISAGTLSDAVSGAAGNAVPDAAGGNEWSAPRSAASGAAAADVARGAAPGVSGGAAADVTGGAAAGAAGGATAGAAGGATAGAVGGAAAGAAGGATANAIGGPAGVDSPVGGARAGSVSLAARGAATVTGAALPTGDGDPVGLLPLSAAQRRMWFLERLHPGQAGYELAVAVRLDGALSLPALAGSVAAVVARHQPLRTVYAEVDGRPLQRVLPAPARALACADLSGLAAGRREGAWRAVEQGLQARPFDLERGPVARFLLVDLGDEARVLLVACHHIAADGWSLEVLFRDLAALYGAALAGQASPLPEPAPCYSDHVLAAERRLTPGALAAQVAWWRGQLAGVEALDLPLDRVRPAQWSSRAVGRGFELDEGVASGLAAVARAEGSTLFATLLAGFFTFLARHGGQEDLAVGVPVAGRSDAAALGMVGLFVNTVVTRVNLAGGPSFGALVRRVRDAALAAQAHQDVPFETLVEELRPARAGGGSPLFQAMFSHLGAAFGEVEMAGLRLELLRGGVATARFDLSCDVHERDGRVRGILDFAAALFEPATATRLRDHFAALLAAAAAAPDGPALELPMLAAAECHQLAVEWNDRAGDGARGATPLDLIAAHAAAAPERLAVVCGAHALSYGELMMQSRGLAARLAALGVGGEDRVGLLLDRSAAVVTAMLGVWQAGAAWVPFDPSLPAARLATLFADAGLAALIVDPGRRPPAGVTVPFVELAPAARDAAAEMAPPPLGEPSPAAPPLSPRPAPRDLAYLIYTSGTTGLPKAVAIEHASLLQTLVAWQGEYPLGAGDRVPVLAPLWFDTSVIEIYAALAAGAAVEMVPAAEILDLPRLVAVLSRATLAFQVPSLLRRVAASILDPDPEPGAAADGGAGLAASPRWPAGPRWLFAAGERVPGDLVRELQESFPATAIQGSYGPTETAVTCATWKPARPFQAGGVERSMVGRPLAGATLLVRDPWGNPAPVGVPGELHIGGGGLARGYLGRPELTADRFRPAAGGQRFYRSGDLTRVLADGSIEFLGRTDHQIKLRGFRIEPGEIEAALRAEDGVLDVVVMAAAPAVAAGGDPAAAGALPGAGADGVGGAHAAAGSGGDERRLTAYVVPASPAALAAAERHRLVDRLRRRLAARLPEYMVPSAWVLLAAFPLAATGKVDRRALPPPPAAADLDLGAAPAAPRTPEEELLAVLWSEVLGSDRVGADSDFFALGGHSLLLTQLASRVRRAFGVEVPLADLFAARTLAEQARRLGELRRRSPASSAAAGAAAGAPAPAAPGVVAALPPIPPLAPLPPAARRAPLPLSFAQERLWLLSRLEPGPLYNMPVAARLYGSLQVAALAAALGEVVRRHESLRTRLAADGGRPLQTVLPWCRAVAARLPLVDLAALPAALAEPAAHRLAEEHARRPFDLASGRMMRSLVLRLAAAEHWLVVVLHHVAADGWSMGVLLDELAVLYPAAAATHVVAPLPELPVQYADFAVWQRGWLAGERLASELDHWRRRLAGAPAALELPADRQRRPDGAARGGHRSFALAPGTRGELALLARRRGWTPFMPLLAAFAAVLARWSGRRAADEVVIGSPVANRNRLEIERLIGFFTNTLALRLDLGGDPAFGELADRARAVCLDAYAHQDLPFERLVEELAPARQAGSTPLFQAMLVLQNVPLRLALPGLAVELLDVDTGTAKFDLMVVLVESDGELGGSFEFRRDLFDDATVERLAGHFRTLLAGAVAAPAARLSALPLLTPEERAALVGWEAAPPAMAADPDAAVRLVPARVAAQAARQPERIAAVFAGRHLSYGELAARARRLARRLRRLGVEPDGLVGLFVERSLEAVVALLGILEAGGAFLALDPESPSERLRLMLEDAAAPVVVTQRHLAARLPASAAHIVAVDAPEPDAAFPPSSSPSPSHQASAPAAAPLPEHLIYVCYTSGSTGRPKGVAMSHRALAAMLDWQLRTSQATDRTLNFTSLSFDVSFQEIFSTWITGGTLVLLADETRRDPVALARLLAAEQVTRLFLPFVALQQLATAALAARRTAFPAALREVLSAGEQLYVTPQVAALLGGLPGAALHNHYGPTEAHAVTWLPLTGDPAAWPERPPIGRPLDHARILLLDAHLRRVPVGVPGEVWAAGPGLARGYLGRPELTADRFLPDPFADVAGWRPGARMYRLGDLARLRPDGTLDFLGRTDFQVKVRGHRIEVAEIETALAHHPAVLQAAVVTYGEDAASRRLVACLVCAPDGPPPGAAELRAFVARTLPGPMVPGAWLRAAHLPLTATGKLDRRTLEGWARAALAPVSPPGGGGTAADEAAPLVPLPDAAAAGAGAARFAPPRHPVEELIAGIWRELLGVAEVGSADDFFALGGHSLLATQVVSRIREIFGVELPLRLLFEEPTPGALAAAVLALTAAAEAAAGAPGVAAATGAGDAAADVTAIAVADGALAAAPAPPPLVRAARDRPLPLSFAQERLWFLHRLQPEGSAYNLPLLLRAQGALDPARLSAAFSRVALRHEVLRTRYAELEGRPVQVVDAPAAVPVPAVDLAALPAARRGGEAERLIAAAAARPFDLARGPALRVLLVQLAAEEGPLLLTNLHHIAADGWSLGVLVREMSAAYPPPGAPPAELPALPVQYADFAVWQRQWLAGAPLARQLAWWRERLRGARGVLELPADRPRPPVTTQRGADHLFTLDAGLAGRLAAAAARHGTTLFMALAGGLAALLARLAGEHDLTLGTPIANRTRIEVEPLIGCFVNLLALRLEVAGAGTFGDLLRLVRETSLGAYAHQDVPFEMLVDELALGRDLSRPPLVQVVMALQNAPLPAAELGGVRLAPYEPGGTTAKFDLTWMFAPGPGGGLEATLQYASDLFDAATAKRLAHRFAVLLDELLRRPEARLETLPLLAPAERHQVLREWNETAAAPPAPSARELTERQAARRPDAVAVRRGDRYLSYGELDARADRLAGLLRELGAGAGDAVALWLDRSPELVAAALAVFKAGAAYLPLDPAWPVARVAAVLEAARAPVLVTLASQLAAAGEPRRDGMRIVCLEAAATRAALARQPARPSSSAAAAVLPASLAYVVYTSGSTGQPKGVAVPHAALASLVQWQLRTVGWSAADRATLAVTPGFDASVLEIWSALSGGASLHAPEAAVRLEPERLLGWMAAEGITLSFLPTALAEQLVEAAERQLPAGLRLRTLLVGGDRLRRGPARPLPFAITNNYGPAECCVVSTVGIYAAGELGGADPAPIGRPVDGMRVYLADAAGEPVAAGTPGEVWLGGRGMARGYLARPELTAERFLPDPWSGEAGARLYRTGDIARLAPTGRLDFLGRLDAQVKVRGCRVEPAEVEAVLGRQPGVRQAVVVPRRQASGDTHLAGYVVLVEPSAAVGASGSGAAGGGVAAAVAPGELREGLARQLPEYMIPAVLVELAAMPLTGNGKIDRAALPAPDERAAAAYTAPRNELERQVAAAWGEVLGREQIGIDESFFAVGGTSLAMVRLQGRLRQLLGREVPLLELFRHPTIEGLAASLGGEAAPAAAAEAAAERARARVATRRESLRRQVDRRRAPAAAGAGDRHGHE